MRLQALGKTGLSVPPIIFGTSCLGNLYEAYSGEVKLEILREILRAVPAPAVLDSAGKYGAGLALETVGNGLRELGVGADDVLISNKLAWLRMPLQAPEPTFEPGVWVGIEHDAVQQISYDGILRCWEQGLALLGAPYKPQLVSVHDPDEYLAAAKDEAGQKRALADIEEAYRALAELRRSGTVRAVGVGAKDWRVVRTLTDRIELDWVMLACSFTIMSHPQEVLRLIETLAARGVGIINSAVFHAGFLTGGSFYDYRRLDPNAPSDQPLFAWRGRFHELCQRHDVAPEAACVRFALSAPGVVSIALNTSKPSRIRRNVELVTAEIPAAFWREMKDARLIRPDYPYLG